MTVPLTPIRINGDLIQKRLKRGAVISSLIAVCCWAIASVGERYAVAQQRNNAPAATRIASVEDGSEDTRYRIGPGDVLTISVRKAPELSGAVRVDQRGMIRLPMIDNEVKAACKTESELASEVTTLYLEYKRNPSVDVFVSDYQSRPVAVIGAINGPGQFRLQRQVRLLELLSLAGGPSARAGRLIEVIHPTTQNLCQAGSDDATTAKTEAASAQTGSLAQEMSVYILTDTLKGNRNANPFVNPGDIVHLPEADLVYVIGHVNSPQAISLKDKPITLSRAIAITGGPARDAKTSRVRIIRQTTDSDKKQEIIVNLSAVMKQQAPDITLMPNDIIEVPSSATKSLLNTLQGAVAPALTQLPVRAIP